jgi:hypothetical protein
VLDLKHRLKILFLIFAKNSSENRVFAGFKKIKYD